MNFWDALGQGLSSGYQKGQEQKQAIGLFGGLDAYNKQLQGLDLNGSTTIQDLTPQGNNVTQKATVGGLFPGGLNIKAPDSSMIGQGLSMLPQSQQQPPATFEQAIAPVRESMNKYSKENNPTRTVTTQPKTLQEAQSMINQSMYQAAKDLADKGHDPRNFIPMLQQAAKDRMDEHTKLYNQQQVSTLLQKFQSQEAQANPYMQTSIAAELKGKYGYDITTPYKEFAPDYKAEKINTGGQQLGLSFNPKTGKYEQQFVVNNTVSPDARLNADTRIKTTEMNNATTLQVYSMRGSGRSGSNNSKPTGKTSTGLTYDQYEKANSRYGAIFEDIWGSPDAQTRIGKKAYYKDELNTLGQFLDKDVDNDLNYIPSGWVDPKGGAR